MTVLAVGTEKGGFTLHGSEGRWDPPAQVFPGWRVTAWGKTSDGRFLAGLASNWFGASVHISEDLETWIQVVEGPAYPAESDLTLEQIWTFHTTEAGILAGVSEAGLFRSVDARTWTGVDTLNADPDRGDWFPGLGGLAAHRILSSDDRIWVGISAVGVLRSHDGGTTWQQADDGITATVDVGFEGARRPGFCVHSLVADDRDPDRIWRQDHSGVYRSDDGATTWKRIEKGLPARFGFPIVRDHASGRLFVIPLASDGDRIPVDGRFAAYRSDDDGDHWEVAGTGWPDVPTFETVLRNAAATDGSGTILFGTTGGTIWATDDAGDTWSQLPFRFPRILSLEIL